MPRASSKRKAAPLNPSSVTSSSSLSAADTPTGKSKTKSKSAPRGVDNIFDSYANEALGVIDPEGIEALCLDMKVEVTDVRILMLAWKLNAQKQGYFTKDEWRTGMKALGVDTISKLVKALPRLENEVEMPENFKDFYSYAFRYCLTEEKQKNVDIESICELLNLVLRSKFQSKIDLLIDYLKIQKDYKVINHDQWLGFLQFCQEIKFPGLENYDPDLAWPLILDNFVDWVKENRGS
ncbi:hypothetical protein Tsubulata_014097 [Turnera subulata]|uniref:Defective in cullin neddylation protein n=1 Tax=Turnera subulata TaxID=218843 RepID=A0A9Q0GAT8_9ROSI|nr:hypothetical protein Tsubulata_014097 [Turnera subulata]